MISIQPSRNNNSYQPPTQPTHPHANHAENITVRITTRPAQPPSITTSNTHHPGNLCHAGITQHTRTHTHATSTQPTMTIHQQNSTNQYHLAGHKHKVLVHHAIEFSNNIRTQHKQPTPNRISHTLRRKHSVTPTQTKNKIRVNTTMHCTPMMPLQRKTLSPTELHALSR